MPSRLEHDSFDDKKGKRLSMPPADKMIDSPPMDKRTRVRVLEKLLRREQTAAGALPHLHIDNPAIWDGEIE